MNIAYEAQVYTLAYITIYHRCMHINMQYDNVEQTKSLGYLTYRYSAESGDVKPIFTHYNKSFVGLYAHYFVTVAPNYFKRYYGRLKFQTKNVFQKLRIFLTVVLCVCVFRALFVIVFLTLYFLYILNCSALFRVTRVPIIL